MRATLTTAWGRLRTEVTGDCRDFGCEAGDCLQHLPPALTLRRDREVRWRAVNLTASLPKNGHRDGGSVSNKRCPGSAAPFWRLSYAAIFIFAYA